MITFLTIAFVVCFIACCQLRTDVDKLQKYIEEKEQEAREKQEKLLKELGKFD